VDFAVGTDTAGSVRVPAAWCGLQGLRPTHARVPVGGLTALAPSFDVVGWLARSSAVMRSVGSVLLGAGVREESQWTLVRDTTGSDADAAVAAAFESMVERCAARGFQVRMVSLALDPAVVTEALRVLQGSEAWNTHGRWIDSARPHFGPGVAERFAAARAVTAKQVHEAAGHRAAINARLDAALPPGLILCLPTVAGPAPRRDASAEELQLQRAQVLRLTALASLSGRPQITLPMPSTAAGPVGFSLLGWRGGDEALLEMAHRL
jgi:amidase